MTRAEEAFNYRYFLIGDVNPVRLTYASKYPSGAIDAHNADRTRPGELKPAIHLIRAVLFKDEDVEEITREQFEEHCRRIWAESRP
jgi:hypothetical protein